MKLRFYRCEVCGKVVTILSDTGVPTVCCGRPMQELEANHTDGAVEKHVPVFFTKDNTLSVRIGIYPHPMTDEHSILWIGLRTADRFGFKELHPGDRPEATFAFRDEDRVEAVYAYCNLHGLWCSEKEGNGS